MISELVTARHLSRKAVVYIRQSHPHQVLSNQESLRLQYALCQRARDLGWQEADVEVVDADLGLSGAAADHRRGFKDLIARVTLGEVGIILSYDVTRLARNCSDWYPLLDLCGYRQCLIADRDGVYDPGSANGRLLLGLKGTISEVELHTMRGRLTAGLLNKAERGELALNLPAGLIRDAGGAVVKDPDREIQDRITLVFTSFLEQGSVAKVMRIFARGALGVPRRDRFGEAVWRPATLNRLNQILKNPAYAGAFVYGRTRSRHTLYPNGKLMTEPCPMAEWKIVVQGQIPGLHRLGKLRADPGDAARQLRGVRPEQDARRAPRGRRAASGHRVVRAVRPQDGCAVPRQQPLHLPLSAPLAGRPDLPASSRRSDRRAGGGGVLRGGDAGRAGGVDARPGSPAPGGRGPRPRRGPAGRTPALPGAAGRAPVQQGRPGQSQCCRRTGAPLGAGAARAAPGRGRAGPAPGGARRAGDAV